MEAGDPDPLDFNAIAQGLSHFLRNDKTQPPLTIAITDEWGSGKSSLMNLLKADLARRGFRPVWFNAWHHQQEEQLLAALLESVRLQGVPSIWRPQGWLFRVRLLLLRSWRHWLTFIFVLSVLVFSAGCITAHPQSPSDAFRQLQQWTNTLTGWGKQFTQDNPSPARGSDQPSFVAFLVSLVITITALRKGLTAFGKDHEERFGQFYGLSSTESYWNKLQEMSKDIRVS